MSGELIIEAMSSMYGVVVGLLIWAVLPVPVGLWMGAIRRFYPWYHHRLRRRLPGPGPGG